MKNWLGVEFHKTDEFLHWSDNLEDAVEIRQLWDLIPKKYHEIVYQLMDKAREYGMLNESDNNAGEAL